MNLPGSLALSASPTFCSQTVSAISGLMSAATGGPPTSFVSVKEHSLNLFGAVGLHDQVCAAGSLLIGEPGSLANFITPTYSE